MSQPLPQRPFPAEPSSLRSYTFIQVLVNPVIAAEKETLLKKIKAIVKKILLIIEMRIAGLCKN